MNRLAAAVIIVKILLLASHADAAPLSFSYGGRLTQGDQAVEGPVDLELRFYRGSSRIATAAFNAVKLVDGVFQVEVTQAQIGNALDGNDDVFVEIVDKTSKITYPQQRLVSMPFALYANKVPVDETTLSFGSDGKLKVTSPFTGAVTDVKAGAGLTASSSGGVVTLGVNAGTTANKVVQLDGSAKLPAVDGSALTNVNSVKLQGRDVDGAATPTNGQVLKWNGNAWTPSAEDNTTGLAINQVTSTTIQDGSITGADIASTAAIEDGKLASITSVGKVSGNVIVSGTIGGASQFTGSGGVATSGNVVIKSKFDNSAVGELRFGALGNSKFLTLKSPNSLISSVTWTLPDSDGVDTQVLTTNGSGGLRWSTPSLSGSIGSGEISDNSITNADINGTAAISDSKLATITAIGKVSGEAINVGTIGGTSTFSGSGGVATTGAIRTKMELIFGNNFNSYHVGFRAPGTLTSNSVWTLPATDGSVGQVLQTNGSGILSWASGAAVSGVAGGDLTGNFPAPTLTLTGVLAGDYAKVTVDATGRVRAGSTTIGSFDIADDSILNGDIASSAAIATSKLSGAITAIPGHGLGSLATVSSVNSMQIHDATIMNADIASTAAIDDSKLATLTTGGKVANSATTATSTNTFNAIVMRDGFGNFAADTITAALNGNAATATTAGNVSGIVAIANGGTNATTATTARNNLSAAASGANSDITSLTGLTTALSINQGGTGATLASMARTNLGLGSLAMLSSIGSAEITNSAIIDADVSPGAGIATSKLSGSVTSIANHGLGTLATLNGVPLESATFGTLSVQKGGTGSTALLQNSVLLGNGTNAPQTVAPGSSGSVLTSNGSTWTSAIPAWQSSGFTVYNNIGNVGIGTTTPSNTLSVVGSANFTGNVGIGTTSAAGILNVYGNVGIGTLATPATLTVNGKFSGTLQPPALKVDGVGQITNSLIVGSLVNYVNPGLLDIYSNDNSKILTVLQTGSVGIGTTSPSYTLHVVGTAGLSTGTAWTNASDLRLKDIAGDYDLGLDEIMRLHTVRFTYKEDNSLGIPVGKLRTGFIAQEVRDIIPEAVTERSDGYLELNVDPIHWAVVNAVKELGSSSYQQQAEIAKLREENEQLKAESEQLKTAFCIKFPEMAFCSD